LTVIHAPWATHSPEVKLEWFNLTASFNDRGTRVTGIDRAPPTSSGSTGELALQRTVSRWYPLGGTRAAATLTSVVNPRSLPRMLGTRGCGGREGATQRVRCGWGAFAEMAARPGHPGRWAGCPSRCRRSGLDWVRRSNRCAQRAHVSLEFVDGASSASSVGIRTALVAVTRTVHDDGCSPVGSGRLVDCQPVGDGAWGEGVVDDLVGADAGEPGMAFGLE